jgi:hypothetical protein
LDISKLKITISGCAFLSGRLAIAFDVLELDTNNKKLELK